MDFVYPWIESEGNELELSVRAIKKHLSNANVFVVGDKPLWWSNDHGTIIRKARIKSASANENLPFADTFSKLIQAVNSNHIDKNFVWMWDDVFFVKPIHNSFFNTAYYWKEWTGDQIKKYKPKSTWLKLKKKTLQQIYERTGKPVKDFATHLPIPVEKKQLIKMIVDWQMPGDMVLWEIVYHNIYSGLPAKKIENNWFFRNTKIIPEDINEQKISNATIVNTGSYNFTEQTQTLLLKLIEPEGELTSLGVPAFTYFDTDATNYEGKAALADHKDPCPVGARGDHTRDVKSKRCGQKGKKLPVFNCHLLNTEVTIDPYMSYQPEGCCKRTCSKFWDTSPAKKLRAENRYRWLVTSFVPKPLQTQTTALRSWKKLGFRVMAVQTNRDDILQLNRIYPEVDFWSSCEGKKEKPRIKQIMETASKKTTDDHFVFANSDIEFDSRLALPLLDKKTLGIGIRSNYHTDKTQARLERWGFDVFIVPTALAKSLPEPRNYSTVGKPWWDYWLPYHALVNDYFVQEVGKHQFFHQRHPLRWSRDEHVKNMNEFCKDYDLKIFNPSRFRSRFRPVMSVNYPSSIHDFQQDFAEGIDDPDLSVAPVQTVSHQ